MKNILIIFLLCMSRVYGQAPAIEWQNTIGGYDYEYFWALQQTSEGGYILGGQSVSDISGDKSEACLGSNDFWIVKLDTAGIIQWQNTIGGDHSDILYSLQQTIDEGYISCGYSESEISGDKTESTIGILGLQDYWVVKLDSIGNIEWQNTIGGDTYDNARVVRQTGDGGYIVGGNSSSPISGDKSDSCIGGSDWWILKLNDIGEIQWQKTIGGDLDDVFCTMEHTVDGGYIVGGYSQSNISGNKTENSVGSSDMWVVKMDSLGNIEWQNTIGGSNWDELRSAEQTIDGGYILGGLSYSDISGDKTESCIGGFPDYWVVKIDSVGNIEWQNTIGGLYYDYGFSIHQTVDGGYIFGGQSASSISGDKTEDSYGNFDYWVLKLSSIGGIDWQATLGGTLVEALTEVRPTFDGGYILGGLSQSGITGIKTEPCIGQYDYWIIKLFPDCSYIQEICNDIDDDCNGIIDDGLTYNTYYNDFDGDGFGDPVSALTICDAFPPFGYVTDNTDCNDFYALINPGMTEICNSVDDNCNALIDEDLPTQVLYIDDDEDNYGNVNFDTITCFLTIAGYVHDSTDCDDSNPLIYPGAPELLDGIDNNCNKVIDEGFNSVENLNNAGITIYPNPANDKIILTINNQFNINSSSYISIYDLSGKNILQMEIKSSEIEIDVSDYAAGIYFVKVIVGGKQFEHKLIIE